MVAGGSAVRSIALAGAASVIAGCGILPPASPPPAWVWPTPFPRPSDVVPVPLETGEVPAMVVPDVIYSSCPLALLPPMTPSYHAEDAARPIHYTLVANGEEVRLVWQVGFRAWLRPGLQIVAPDGKLIAAEGQVVTGLGGGELSGDGRFTICISEYTPRRTGEQP